jgi:hypothetical protein
MKLKSLLFVLFLFFSPLIATAGRNKAVVVVDQGSNKSSKLVVPERFKNSRIGSPISREPGKTQWTENASLAPSLLEVVLSIDLDEPEQRPNEVAEQSSNEVSEDCEIDLDVRFKFACQLLRGDGGISDPESARVHFKLAADQGHREAQFKFARMLFKGVGGRSNLKSARDYMKLAADQGHLEAQFQYALMVRQGIGGRPLLKVAREYFNLATNQGHREAPARYGLMFFNGEGGSIDHLFALHFFKLGTNRGDADAQFYYAYMLENGIVEDVNLIVAFEFYSRAAEQGHPDAIQAVERLINEIAKWDEENLPENGLY